jgi:hypothetical protein
MLHVTNGDSAATVLRQAVDGPVLPWRDILHDGPVPAMPDDEFRQARARFIAGAGWEAYDAALRAFEARDAALAAERDAVVLWFEHDLYDQLQLIQILDRLADDPPASLTLINIGSHPEIPNFAGLGQLNAAQMAALLPDRRPVTAEQLAAARRAWTAFRAPDPSGLEQVGDTSSLPFLAAAIRRHLEQFPGERDGLSRTERQILAIVAGGVSDPIALFKEDQRREEAVWQGDWPFFRWVAGLAHGETPLLAIQPAGAAVTDQLRSLGITGPIAITDAGRRVLAGEDDLVHLNGIDRWYGGVHLEGRSVLWRWGGERLVRAWSAGTGD